MSEEIPLQEQQSQPASDVKDLNGNDEQATSFNVEEADAVKKRMEEMEKEAAKLRELHSQLSKEGSASDEEKKDVDSRSIYIGNVDYASTPLELQQHFSSAGVVNRVTILMNKFTGQPKGFAYLEFSDIDGVNKAVATLDGSTFRDRELKVSAKRTNLPGMSNSRGRFMGGRGRGSFRGGFRGRGRGRGAFRGGSRFTPY
ncbi:uncharacterized protein PRCAT00005009001 [Priceomyces carsonii]|uniref:uncharacterized protein n=1 Tax=Priceomyces carsonii TaxID=28549 RepID=UPI002EDAE7C3|nr:unnamed protein product [Priceomyces carsonii]